MQDGAELFYSLLTMSLGPGQRLGPYEVSGTLGAGGTGQVFRARDTRLGREVAHKVLPDDLAGSAESRSRLEHEAKLLASLKKFFNVGFEAITVVERKPFGLAELARYPLFAADFLNFLRRVMPPVRHDDLVFFIVVTAAKPAAEWAGASAS